MMKSERKFFRNLIKRNENITFLNLCDTTKAVLRRTYVCKCVHRTNRERLQTHNQKDTPEDKENKKPNKADDKE